jgi:hypothetical protein
MDSTYSVISRQAGLKIVTGMINHRGPESGQYRHTRMLRELALSPAKLAGTIADDLRDRSTVLRIAFRHAFLRAPLPALRVADPSAIPWRTETNRHQMTPIRNNFRLGAKER